MLTVLKYCQQARKELHLFECRIKEVFVYHMDPLLPLNLFIFSNKLSPTGIMAQEDQLWNGFIYTIRAMK